MRWFIVVALIAGLGCKRSDKQAPAAPTPAAEDAAPVAAAADAAAPPAMDAAPVVADAGTAAATPASGPAAFAGSYEIAFELPKKYKCEDDKAKVEPRQTFDVAIDPADDSLLVVSGTDGGWEASEVSTGGDKGQYLYVTLTNKADSEVQEKYFLEVKGSEVTGTVRTEAIAADVDPSCTPYLEIKITGTRTPKP